MAETMQQQSLNPELAAYIERLIERWSIVGLSVCIIRRDGEVEFGSFGVADDDDTPVTPDTLFGIASCSKAFAGFALAQVIEDYETGRNTRPLPSELESIAWSTPIKRLLPDIWQIQDEWTSERATLKDTAAHVTGIPIHDLSFSPHETPEVVVNRLRHIKPNRTLREEWQYNNMMYMVNQTIITRLSGQPYTQFVKERILDVAGMRNSTYSVSEAMTTNRLARGFAFVGLNKDIKRSEPHFITEDSINLIAAAGGLISNVRDMSRWVKTLLAKGVAPDSQAPLLQASAFKYSTTGHYVRDANGPMFPELSTSTYGGGWFRYNYQSHEIVYHPGGSPGLSTQTVFLPNDNIGMCFLSNTGSRQLPLLALTHRVVEHVLGLEKIDWDSRFWDIQKHTDEAWKMKLTTRKKDAQLPSLSLAAYCGTYNNLGHGSLTLHARGGPSSPDGDQVISDFETIKECPSDPFTDDVYESPQLFCAWDRMWGSHLRLRHMQEETWSATVERFYLEGSGKDKTPFVRIGFGPFTVQFVTKSGVVKGMNFMENTMYTPQTKKAGDEMRTIFFERVAEGS